jgi:hypothetical protein
MAYEIEEKFKKKKGGMGALNFNKPPKQQGLKVMKA